MAIFHAYALYPMLSNEALKRVGLFFVLNGIATVVEVAIWGVKKHWLRAVLAWVFETAIASWTASAVDIPRGLANLRWWEICEAR